MPNHGKCQNCWWYKETNGESFYIGYKDVLMHTPGKGICYMHSSNIGFKDAEMYYFVECDSYCPEYWNRKYVPKREGTLDEWIKKQYE